MGIIKNNIKLHTARTLMRLFYAVPVKKKIFFSSYEGRQFSCNPKYIFLRLKDCSDGFKIVYEYNDTGHIPEELKGVTVVRHNSFQYFFHLLTAKVIVSNNAISPKIPVRRSQYVINTWHGGGAFKKVGIDIDSKVNGMDINMLKLTAEQTDLFLASSEGFYEGTGRGSCIPREKVFFVGMPRNDIFFTNNDKQAALNKKVRDFYRIDETEKILLYAPTFRGKTGAATGIQGEPLNWDMIKKALNCRFTGNWKLMFRGHYHSKESLGGVDDIIDASTYPDMQELLIASDAMITDYSSVIWDYSLTGKPGFLFCSDLDQYKNERDFYSPIEDWPYLYAKSNDGLCNIILEYTEDANSFRCNRYFQKMCSYEDGCASETVSKKLLDLINH